MREFDLHGLSPEQAARRLAQELHACRVRGLDRLRVITFDDVAPDADAELELGLPRGGAIAGRLEFADGASPLGWTMRASDGLAAIAEAAVAADGSFRFDDLHPGGWQVRAFEPAGRFHARSGRLATDRAPLRRRRGRRRALDYVHASGPRASRGGSTRPGCPSGASPHYQVKGEALRITCQFELEADGRFGPLRLPVGPGLLRDPRTDVRETGPVWAELDLAPGETVRPASFS